MTDSLTDSMTTTIDVRKTEPQNLSPTVLEAFDRMDAGDSFVLVNDQDPKPLFYLFSAERPEQFTWDYLEKGPALWRVQIGKLEEETSGGGCCGCCGGD